MQIADFDGSSDIFVLKSMVDELSNVLEALPRSVEFLLVVMDEFHMMSNNQKYQLLSWIRINSAKVKLCMVSNRKDKSDEDMLREHFDNFFCILQCRGSIPRFIKIIQKISPQSMDGSKKGVCERRFFCHFLRASRGLFGEEMLTFRFYDPLKRLFESYFVVQGFNPITIVEEIAKLIHHKLPYLDFTFVSEFVTQVLEIYDLDKCQIDSGIQDDLGLEAQFKNNFQEKQSEIFSNLVSTLVWCSGLDFDGNFSSFPEFVTCIPSPLSQHPILKILKWANNLHFRVFREPISEVLMINLFHSWKRHFWVDMPARFPHVQLWGGGSDGNSCEVAVVSVDYSDVDEIIRVHDRGYSINWREAG